MITVNFTTTLPKYYDKPVEIHAWFLTYDELVNLLNNRPLMSYLIHTEEGAELLKFVDTDPILKKMTDNSDKLFVPFIHVDIEDTEYARLDYEDYLEDNPEYMEIVRLIQEHIKEINNLLDK
jgi:hypothetical protein